MVLATNKFHMPDATKQRLFSLGFKYHSPNKDGSNDIYIYRFPVHKYKRHTTIECEVTTECNSGSTLLNFYDKASKTMYYPFYGMNIDQYSKAFLSSMDRRVRKELKRLGVEWK